MPPPAFELVDVEKRYGRSVDALRGLNLSGAPGQVTGLLGSNGAGKTTAVKCLAGLVRPTAGRASIQGEDARLPRARARLGYMPERAVHPPYQTAAELLDREGRLFGLPRAERRARTALLLDRVGLTENVYERPVGTYSKGERARLGLALALMGDPQVVLLDEPTDGLDPVGRRSVRELLLDLRREGRAVLLNSHLLSEVEQSCDRVVILKHGRAVAQGAPSELLAGRGVVYRVRLGAPPNEALLDALRPLSASLSVDGEELRVGLSAPEEVDGVVDRLRERGASIRELRSQASLEDVFMDLMNAGSAPDPKRIEVRIGVASAPNSAPVGADAEGEREDRQQEARADGATSGPTDAASRGEEVP